MRLFRGMRPDATGLLPKIMCGKSSLDVTPDEITIINGLAQPETGGMSVVANDFKALPGHRKPPSLGGSSKGYEVFWISEQALPETLVARQDRPSDFAEHRSIEPSEVCAFERFRENIISTCQNWTPVR